jgi:DNA replication protein DnaC
MPSVSEEQKIVSIKENCSVCSGEGFLITANADGSVTLTDCQCIKEMEWQFRLLNSNIPKRYLNWDMSMIYPEFIKNNTEAYEFLVSYVDNLEENIANGEGFWLASPPGLAKSSIISYIIQTALEKNYTGYFSKAADLQNLKFSALGDDVAQEKIEYILEDVHILGLEELEKVYLTHDAAMPNYLFYQLISDLYDEKKAILISTNEPRDSVLNALPAYISDRLSSITYMTLTGKSGRRK